MNQPAPVLVLSDKSRQVQTMFDAIAPRYDLLNRLLSARQDVRWRRALVRSLPTAVAADGVLFDVACGTGDVCLNVARDRRDYQRISGLDISQGMIDVARSREPLNRIRTRRQLSGAFDLGFTLASAEELPLASNSGNALTIAFGLRNVDNRQRALCEFSRVLKPGGRVLILEFFEAESSFFSKIFQVYFKFILPFIGGLFSSREAYEYLPQSVSTMPNADEFKNMLEMAGFEHVTEQRWLGGATRLFTADKK